MKRLSPGKRRHLMTITNPRPRLATVLPFPPARRPLHYDRKGRPMAFDAWAVEFERGLRHVGHSNLPNGLLVSTVWLGLDHSFGGGTPLIFETMVFADGNTRSNELAMKRYATEEEAARGHLALVQEWAAWQP